MTTQFGSELIGDHPYDGLTLAFIADTSHIPDAPIAFGVGYAVAELLAAGASAEDLVQWPYRFGPEHLAAMQEAVSGESGAHAVRGLATLTERQYRWTAGLVVASLVTTAAELRKGWLGRELPTIPMPEENDILLEGVTALEDPDTHALFAQAMAIGQEVVHGDDAWKVIRPFRSRITRIALAYAGVTPESNPAAFGQKMEELKGQRDLLSTTLGGLLIPALEARLPGDVDLEVIETFAHNATRVTPDDAWLGHQ